MKGGEKMTEEKKGKTNSLNLPQNTEAALAYLAGWVTGLIFLFIEKENKFVRFHAMQSIIAFGGLTILAMVPFIGWILWPLVMIVSFILWLICLVKAYQGEKFKLPVVGDLAEKQLGKIK